MEPGPMPRGPMPPLGTPLWTVPMALGALIFLFGILVWVVPELLAYLVAAAFCAVGLSVMAFAWRLRPRRGGPGRGAPGGSYVEFRVDREQEPN